MSTHPVNVASYTKTEAKCIKSRVHADENSIIDISINIEFWFLENDWINDHIVNFIVGYIAEFRKIWLTRFSHIARLSQSLALPDFKCFIWRILRKNAELGSGPKHVGVWPL